MKKVLTHERLLKLLHFNSVTGVFTNRITRGPNAIRGSVAGTTTALGYTRIEIDGRPYRAHRLAVFYVEGKMPENQIDHIVCGENGRSNNAYANLRHATVQVNSHNRKHPPKNSKTGFLGVHRQGKKFYAGITVNYEYRYLGTFDTPEKASAAYWKAKAIYHPTAPTALG